MAVGARTPRAAGPVDTPKTGGGVNAGTSTRSRAPGCRPKIVGVVSGPLGPPPAQGGVSGRGSAAGGGRGAAGPTRTN